MMVGLPSKYHLSVHFHDDWTGSLKVVYSAGDPSAAARRLQKSPFAIDLVAEDQRISEDPRFDSAVMSLVGAIAQR